VKAPRLDRMCFPQLFIETCLLKGIAVNLLAKSIQTTLLNLVALKLYPKIDGLKHFTSTEYLFIGVTHLDAA
jgi:hypothetical protein